MAYVWILCMLFLLHTCTAAASPSPSPSSNYIVHFSQSRIPSIFASPKLWYSSILASINHYDPPLYTYQSVLHGFSARLTPSQISALAAIPGFLGAFPDTPLHLHTTHTPTFLHLSPDAGLWPACRYGDDVIVGVLDTGVWPERQSFADEGLGAVPARWNGECETGAAFNASLCNKKLIGARAFFKGYEAAKGPMNETKEYKSARDGDGHGTHTSSTAAGQVVYNASLLGYASGTASGMAPRARVAVYKVCWEPGCYDSDILAAFDAAIADGVDIISLSVGGKPVPFFIDPIAIGAYAAMERGILVSCSAGNSGPTSKSVTNVAPWILTVGASTIDREFPAPVILGNGERYDGISLYGGDGLDEKQLPVVYGANAAIGDNASSAALCIRRSLNSDIVRGKIVVCDRGSNARVDKGFAVKEAGGYGMILANGEDSGEELTADSHVLPATLVGYKEGLAIKAYINQTSNPTASIVFQGTKLDVKPAPVIAAFSSRGPNVLTSELLKPDVTAPGVNILAAWTGAIGPTGQPGDDRIVDFNIISGTSMSCPHVSGLAALLKAVHSDWSPSAIKSALMTTATVVDNTGGDLRDGATSAVADPFSYGAGHVNPEAALDPGLVYEVSIQDYVDFLCSLHYSRFELEVFTKGHYTCSSQSLRAGDLNYPSFSVGLNPSAPSSYSASFKRVVTNVDSEGSVYTATVTAPPGVRVKVEPKSLSFGETQEKLAYKVTFEVEPGVSRSSIYSFGDITWTDGKHRVRSPVAVTWMEDDNTGYAASL